MAEEQSAFDSFGLPIPVEGQRNDEGLINAIATEEVSIILRKISKSLKVTFEEDMGGYEHSFDNSISMHDLEVLNKFVATLSGNPNCKVRAHFGCWSCESKCLSGTRGVRWGGHRLETDCGVFCVFDPNNCGREAC
jgi:hypothetical protein